MGYRVDTRPPGPSVSKASDDSDELALIAGLCLLWLASAARVACAFLRRQTFEGEANLALLAVVFVPLLVADTAIAWRRGVAARTAADGTRID